MRRAPAVVLVLPRIDTEKQERLVLPYLAERRLCLTSVTGDHRAVLELVRAQLVEVVVVAVDTPAVCDLEIEVHTAGGRLEIVRRRARRQVPETVVVRVRQAAARGASPEAIAAVLDLPLSQVFAALGLPGGVDVGGGERRPALTGGRR